MSIHVPSIKLLGVEHHVQTRLGGQGLLIVCVFRVDPDDPIPVGSYLGAEFFVIPVPMYVMQPRNHFACLGLFLLS